MQIKKLENEKLELITGFNEATGDTYSEKKYVLEKFDEVCKSKKAQESQLATLEQELCMKKDEILKATAEMQNLHGMNDFKMS